MHDSFSMKLEVLLYLMAIYLTSHIVVIHCLTIHVDAFIPIHEFWVDSRELSEVQRCGGLVSHLNKVLGGRYLYLSQESPRRWELL